MLSEEIEFAITQYADGTLPDAERAELEPILQSDAEARRALDEYRRLDALVKSAGAQLPDIRWDALADHISAKVSNLPLPAQSYKMPAWWQRSGLIALAASVLIVLGVGIRLMRSPALPQAKTVAIARADVDGPQPEAPHGAVVADVEIGPPPLAMEMSSDAQAVVARRSHVSIYSALSPSPGHRRSD